MYFTKISDNSSIIDYICLTTRMKIWLACLWIIFRLISHSYSFKKFFYNSFHCKEISISKETKSKINAFCWKFFFIIRRNINCSKFIQLNIFISSVIIC